MDGDDRPPTIKIQQLEILSQDMLEVQVHFGRSPFVIFLRVSPSISHKVSKQLGWTKNNSSSPYWDTLSNKESEKRLILLPLALSETEKSAIKEAFALCGIYKEIAQFEAEKILANCSPKDLSSDPLPCAS